MSGMKSYKYILLDWDGNLARTLDIWLEALKAPVRRRGHNLTDEQIGANFTIFQERMKLLGIEDIDAMVAEADEIATKEVPNVELYPDAIATIEELHKAGKRIALVTTSRHDQIDSLLKKHKLMAYFDTVVCGDDVERHKPHPEPIERALEMLGASKQEAVMVGDSGSDIIGARNACIDSVLFFPPTHSSFYDIEKLRELEPTYIIEDFRELIKIAA